MNDSARPELSVQKSLELDAPVEKVWRAISEPDLVARWFSDEVRAEAFAAGATGEFFWREHGAFAFEVEVVDPPHHLVWHWARDPDTGLDEGASTRVDWRLEALPGQRTRLVLVETGFADEAARRDNDGGWDSELGELRGWLES